MVGGAASRPWATPPVNVHAQQPAGERCARTLSAGAVREQASHDLSLLHDTDVDRCSEGFVAVLVLHALLVLLLSVLVGW